MFLLEGSRYVALVRLHEVDVRRRGRITSGGPLSDSVRVVFMADRRIEVSSDDDEEPFGRGLGNVSVQVFVEEGSSGAASVAHGSVYRTIHHSLVLKRNANGRDSRRELVPGGDRDGLVDNDGGAVPLGCVRVACAEEPPLP